MGYLIREMSAGDWPEVLEVFSQGVATNMAVFDLDCPSYEEWDKSHCIQCRLVAEDDYEVVGWTALNPVSDKDYFKGIAELSVYVDFDHKRQGIGEELVNAAVARSVKYGYWSVVSYVLEENISGVKLFEKCGFRKVGFYERPAKDRFGVWRSLVIFERRVQTDKAGGCDCAYYKARQAE